MAAVGVWGTTLALGALLYGYDPETGDIKLSVNPLRGLIVFAFVAAFLGFWAIMLSTRRSNSSKVDEHEIDSGHKPANKPLDPDK